MSKVPPSTPTSYILDTSQQAITNLIVPTAIIEFHYLVICT
jgi:hypothetical protein